MRYMAGMVGDVALAGAAAGILGMSGATAAGRIHQSVAEVGRPNVVFILTDDVGYGDISANGDTKVKTPNIDRIANEGIRFTNAYAPAATCTPSRYALMTGEYAIPQTRHRGVARGCSHDHPPIQDDPSKALQGCRLCNCCYR